MTDEQLVDLIYKTDKCILWPYGRTTKNYGALNYKGKSAKAHRVIGFLFGLIESLDSEKQINHKVECTNRLCINPKHLYAGTQSDNMYDRVESGNDPLSSRAYCRKGHEFSGENLIKEGRARRCRKCSNQKSLDYYNRTRRKKADES